MENKKKKKGLKVIDDNATEDERESSFEDEE
jgi:hypothetical protein